MDIHRREYLKLKKDQLFVFSSGEYSDFGYGMAGKALKDFDMYEAAREWEKDQKPYGSDEENIRWKRLDYRKKDAMSFEAWLVKQGLIEELDLNEIHVETYGRFEI